MEPVYRAKLDALLGGTDDLLSHHTAIDALQLWFVRYATFVTTERAMQETLIAVPRSCGTAFRFTQA